MLVLSFSALIIAYALPARAGDSSPEIQIAFDLQGTLAPRDTVAAPDSLFQPVSQTVLAAQRGAGAAFAIPAVPASQSQPGVVLWDELKPAQVQSISSPGGQAVNQINPIQIR
ncbi:MAG: hypothetical protein ACREEL_14305 [Stellaceae bacterium]